MVDHDEFVKNIQADIIEAVDEAGWQGVLKTCWRFNISISVVKKIYNWEPRRSDTGQVVESFNLAKLLDAQRWAKEVIANAPKNNRLPF
jgi:hypothetical protein